MRRLPGKPLFAILILFVLAFSALGSTTAYADDATPPPATEEPAPPVVEPTPPVVDETDPNSLGETTDESTDSVSIEETTSAEIPDCPPQPVDEENLPEDPESAIPEDTSLPCIPQETGNEAVTDAPETSDDSESLASAAEAEDLFATDPMWCPAGVLPGGLGCTASFAGFAGPTGLIAALEAGSYAGAGTIYIASNYNLNEPVILDYGNIGLTDLVFQGGWDFMSNRVMGETTFRQSVEFYDWGGYGVPGSLTINDINLTTLGGDGLYIGNMNDTTTANVILNNVSVSNQDYGTSIETSGSVTVNNSDFTQSSWDGIDIYADGDVILNNVTASNNAYDGVYITGNNDYYAGNVSVNGGTFTNNGDGTYSSAYGLNVYACQLNLNGAPSFGGNQSGDVFFGQGSACGNSEDDDKDNKKPQTSGSTSSLCAVSELKAGDIKGSLNNLCGINVLMSEILEKDLPGELPADRAFRLGVKISAVELPTGGYIELYFPVPEGVDAANLIVLFWNETEWVETPGGEVRDGFLVIKVSKPGVYVLSSK